MSCMCKAGVDSIYRWMYSCSILTILAYRRFKELSIIFIGIFFHSELSARGSFEVDFAGLGFNGLS